MSRRQFLGLLGGAALGAAAAPLLAGDALGATLDDRPVADPLRDRARDTYHVPERMDENEILIMQRCQHGLLRAYLNPVLTQILGANPADLEFYDGAIMAATRAANRTKLHYRLTPEGRVEITWGPRATPPASLAGMRLFMTSGGTLLSVSVPGKPVLTLPAEGQHLDHQQVREAILRDVERVAQGRARTPSELDFYYAYALGLPHRLKDSILLRGELVDTADSSDAVTNFIATVTDHPRDWRELKPAGSTDDTLKDPQFEIKVLPQNPSDPRSPAEELYSVFEPGGAAPLFKFTSEGFIVLPPAAGAPWAVPAAYRTAMAVQAADEMAR